MGACGCPQTARLSGVIRLALRQATGRDRADVAAQVFAIKSLLSRKAGPMRTIVACGRRQPATQLFRMAAQGAGQRRVSWRGPDW